MTLWRFRRALAWLPNDGGQLRAHIGSRRGALEWVFSGPRLRSLLRAAALWPDHGSASDAQAHISGRFGLAQTTSAWNSPVSRGIFRGRYAGREPMRWMVGTGTDYLNGERNRQPSYGTAFMGVAIAS